MGAGCISDRSQGENNRTYNFFTVLFNVNNDRRIVLASAGGAVLFRRSVELESLRDNRLLDLDARRGRFDDIQKSVLDIVAGLCADLRGHKGSPLVVEG